VRSRAITLKRRFWGVGAALVLLLGTWAAAAAGLGPFGSLSSASACGVAFPAHTGSGDIRMALGPGGPWYDSSLPSLTSEIPGLVRNLFPGASGRMVGYAKNVGAVAGTPTFSLSDLVDTGGEYTSPERRVEPQRDVGDLSANMQLRITYNSSSRPGRSPQVVAQGTLRELAAPGRVFSAPSSLAPYAGSGEVCTWGIELAIPSSADNRIQGDCSACTMTFGLAPRM
jgi:hypothetical protein